FIDSDYCFSHDMKAALERHDSGRSTVVPVIIRPCDWRSSPFAKLKPLPDDERPVTRWTNRDSAWTNIVESIRQLVKNMSPGIDPDLNATGKIFSFKSDSQLSYIINIGAHDPDPRFVEPAGTFAKIDEAFGLDDPNGPPRRVVALVGIPGTGKATLAWHYV